MNQEIERLPYETALFVNRRREIQEALERARRVSQGVEERRVVFFYGERGSGKTWLLKKLERDVSEKFSFATYFIDLEQEKSRDVNVLCARAPSERPLAVFVDSVEAVDEGFRNELLERLLSPLAQERWVLIMLAERGRPSYWPDPAFRERAETYDLGPFEWDDIQELIERQTPGTSATVDVVFELSRGYPWLTYLLAKRWPDRLGALKRAAALFLEGVEDDLCCCLKALCVLRAFDESRMAELVPIHCPELAKEVRDYPHQVRLRQRLVRETTMVRWNDGLGGWVIDEPVRRTLEALLREEDEELWERLHCAAYRLYRRWAEEFGDERWAEEADHHANSLSHRLDACPGRRGQEEG